MDDFETIWQQYPRKVAKHPARLEWAKLSPEDRFAAMHSLPIHVRYWRLSGRTMELIPHLRTWLYQRRWEDELEMPQAVPDNDWMRSTAGIERKAVAVGVQARPGENHMELKARILAKERAA